MAKKKYMGLFHRLVRFSARIFCLFIIFSLLEVFIIRLADPPVTMPVLVIWIKSILSSEDYVMPKSEWRPIKNISPDLVRAVLAAEDQRFMSHRGFDFKELDRSARDIINNKRIRGASTITMQMARSVFLWKSRSITRKLAEAYYTVLIEFIMPKIRIMELYLNTVDWGDGVIGAEAASKKYFHKSASELTAHEASLMAAILPNPHAWSSVKPSKYILMRQKSILRNMHMMHL